MNLGPISQHREYTRHMYKERDDYKTAKKERKKRISLTGADL